MLEISGNETIADHLAGQSIQELELGPGTSRLAEFRAGLEHLAGLPQAELERLAAETLDCCSHRLDAVGDLPGHAPAGHAAQDGERDSSAASAGLRTCGRATLGQPGVRPRPVGAAGGERRDPAQKRPPGRRADDPGALALDLSSQRVARALELSLDGAGRASRSALLGYRLERGLRDRRIELAGYVLALRRAAPLATATDGFPDNRPVEALAARDVVDGLACSTAGGRTPRRSSPARRTFPPAGPTATTSR